MRRDLYIHFIRTETLMYVYLHVHTYTDTHELISIQITTAQIILTRKSSTFPA